MIQTYNPGGYTSDNFDALRKQMLAEIVYQKTLDMIEFQDAVVMQATDQLDHHIKLPRDHTLPTFQITEGASSEYQKMRWYTNSFTLDKFRSKLLIDDESKVRLDENVQWNYSLQGVARGMAQARDNEILYRLYNAVGTETTASAKWNTDSADILGDIADLIEATFDTDDSNVTEDELRNVVVYYPLKLFGRIRLPEMLRNGGSTSGVTQGRLMVDSTAIGWAQREIGFNFRGSRKLNGLNEALVVIPGPQTAVHYSYTGGKIPTVETTRDADEGADAYMVTQYYHTFPFPQNYDHQTVNYRLMRIKTVSD
jgi:hypothetical protein